MKLVHQKDACTLMFIITLFKIAKRESTKVFTNRETDRGHGVFIDRGLLFN